MADWEPIFQGWSLPASDSEEARYQHVENMVRDALHEHPAFDDRTYSVFAQGSYRNNTNVRNESDVDLVVRSDDMLFSDRKNLAAGTTNADLGLLPALYYYSTFRDDAERALVRKFGRGAVERGNKAIRVRETSYRVNADVVPAFEHRRYNADKSFLSGIEFIADDGQVIINWPDQHYANGVTKNDATRRRFKRIVRIVKRLRNRMAAEGVASAAPIPSFLIECLMWNAPDERFADSRLLNTVRAVFASIWTDTISDEPCSEWGEVSELLYLFRPAKPWTRAQAHQFISDAWDYIGID